MTKMTPEDKMRRFADMAAPDGTVRVTAELLTGWADTLKTLREERDEAQAQASHEHCHDTVCNGSRKHPRGTKGVCCGCSGRDFAYAEAESLRTQLATLEGLVREEREHWQGKGSVEDYESVRAALDAYPLPEKETT